MAESIEFPFPTVSQHTTILGRNGSGKTQCAAWLLSHAPFDIMPFIIIDHKNDGLINSVGATVITIHENPPSEPGLYILHVLPNQEEEIDDFLWKVYAKGHTGLYFDEGFMVAKLDSVDAILMQGRSKEIPVYMLSQRPVWISRYAFSEASHVIVFHLHHKKDREKVKEFFDKYHDERLPAFHAQWYDVNKDRKFILNPVPSGDSIRERFKKRLTKDEEPKVARRFI